MVIFFRSLISGERLKCGTAEKERPERSELGALSAVATTDLFGVGWELVTLENILPSPEWL